MQHQRHEVRRGIQQPKQRYWHHNILPVYTESNFYYTAFSSKITVSSWVTIWMQEDKSNNTATVCHYALTIPRKAISHNFNAFLIARIPANITLTRNDGINDIQVQSEAMVI